MPLPLMFWAAPPIKSLSAHMGTLGPRRRGTSMSMHSAPRLQAQPSAPGLMPLHAEAHPASHFVGSNTAWRKLLMQVDMVAPHVRVAAIEGEPGVGKQTLARYLHSRSPLAQFSFHRRDAREWLATGAAPSAPHGFLYLDRVDLLAAPGQCILLGVLKTLHDRLPARAVVVASSQTPLRQMAAQGLLLPDLAFRLTAVRFAIPALRQRREEIAPLAQALLERICARYQQQPVSLAPDALVRLLQHSWPGNVRELASVLESSLLDTVNGLIRTENLRIPADIEQRAEPHPATPADHLELDDVIRKHVHYVLDLNRGNKLRAARQLGISRSTLYRLLGNQTIIAQ